jgi:hypothetical protein
MTAPPVANRDTSDRTAARLARIVIILAAVIEAIVMGLAFFSKHGHGVQ